MMKKRSKLFSACIVLACGLLSAGLLTGCDEFDPIVAAGSLTYWFSSYGGSGENVPEKIRVTAAGDWLMAGSTTSFGVKGSDIWLIKTDSAGRIKWQKALGGDDVENTNALQVTADGGYIVAGTTKSAAGTNRYLCLFKFDAADQLQWKRIYTDRTSETFYDIREIGGGYNVIGTTDAPGKGYDIWVMRLNATGGIIYSNYYGYTGSDYAYAVQPAAAGSLIIAGATDRGGSGDFDFYVLKLAADGSLAWQKTLGAANLYESARAITANAGHYIIAGSREVAPGGEQDYWVIALAEDGTLQWQKSYQFTYDNRSGDEEPFELQSTSDNNLVICGQSTAAYSINQFACKLDSSGRPLWNFYTSYLGSKSSLAVLAEHEFAMLGEAAISHSSEMGWNFGLLKIRYEGGDLFPPSELNYFTVEARTTALVPADGLGTSGLFGAGAPAGSFTNYQETVTAATIEELARF